MVVLSETGTPSRYYRKEIIDGLERLPILRVTQKDRQTSAGVHRSQDPPDDPGVLVGHRDPLRDAFPLDRSG